MENKMYERFRKADNSYVRKVWATECCLPLKEYAENINSRLKYVTGNPVVVERKRKKDNKSFYKVEVPLQGGTTIEFDLTFNDHEFEIGDELILDTVQICIETSVGEDHQYITGDTVD